MRDATDSIWDSRYYYNMNSLGRFGSQASFMVFPNGWNREWGETLLASARLNFRVHSKVFMFIFDVP